MAFFSEKFINLNGKIVGKYMNANVNEMQYNIPKYQICKILIDKDNGKKIWYDCQDEEIKSTNAMNRHYRRKRKENILEEDVSTVWILSAREKDKKQNYIQVGRSKNLKRMLSGDIRLDVKEIINTNNEFGGTKYNKLIEKYSELIFFEVDLEKYFFNNFTVNIPEDTNLKKIYWSIIAAWAEGKIAAENNCKKDSIDDDRMWNPSPDGLDGYFYSYYRECEEKSVL